MLHCLLEVVSTTGLTIRSYFATGTCHQWVHIEAYRVAPPAHSPPRHRLPPIVLNQRFRTSPLSTRTILGRRQPWTSCIRMETAVTMAPSNVRPLDLFSRARSRPTITL
jgi:hypothetical protein